VECAIAAMKLVLAREQREAEKAANALQPKLKKTAGALQPKEI
jgi:hypothetical protein